MSRFEVEYHRWRRAAAHRQLKADAQMSDVEIVGYLALVEDNGLNGDLYTVEGTVAQVYATVNLNRRLDETRRIVQRVAGDRLTPKQLDIALSHPRVFNECRTVDDTVAMVLRLYRLQINPRTQGLEPLTNTMTGLVYLDQGE
jgi:hypothetical protein